MPNHKGPPVASIITTTRKGDHNYAIIKLDHNDQATVPSPPTPTTTTTIDNAVTTILCSSCIPFHISIPEFLSFVAPVDSFVSHYRVIR
jgi:BRCA1-associated protein